MVYGTAHFYIIFLFFEGLVGCIRCCIRCGWIGIRCGWKHMHNVVGYEPSYEPSYEPIKIPLCKKFTFTPTSHTG